MYKNIRSICYCSLRITQEYVSTYREDLHGSLDSENYEKDENNENLLLGAFIGIPKITKMTKVTKIIFGALR